MIPAPRAALGGPCRGRVVRPRRRLVPWARLTLISPRRGIFVEVQATLVVEFPDRGADVLLRAEPVIGSPFRGARVLGGLSGGGLPPRMLVLDPPGQSARVFPSRSPRSRAPPAGRDDILYGDGEAAKT